MAITYNIRIKEKGSENILTPSYTSNVKLSRQFIIGWFGLEQPDVEWYEIEEVE